MAESKNDIDPELTEDAGTGPGCLGTTVKSGLVALVVIVVVVIVIFVEKVNAWEVGLRYWNVPIPGLVGRDEAQVLEPGYNIIIPYLHEFQKFDCRIQRFEMAPSYRDMPTPDMDPLKVRTARDQDEIDVYVTILYKVDPEKAIKVRQHFSNNDDIRRNGIATRCPQELQYYLGKIATANQFYGMTKKKIRTISTKRKVDSDYLRDKYPTEDDLLDRTGQVEKARTALNGFFNDKGVEIVDVLIWDFKFKDEIEASIISKVIADEKVEMETALKAAAEQRAEWQRLVAQAYAAVEAELARGTAESRKLDAEAQKYLTEKTARGDKLILKAQAEGKGRINRALGGDGGRVYVGLEYAKALEGINLIVLPAGGEDGMNPFDLDKTLKQIQPSKARRTVQ